MGVFLSNFGAEALEACSAASALARGCSLAMPRPPKRSAALFRSEFSSASFNISFFVFSSTRSMSSSFLSAVFFLPAFAGFAAFGAALGAGFFSCLAFSSSESMSQESKTGSSSSSWSSHDSETWALEAVGYSKSSSSSR
ncbi:hypothetical protein OGATHE_005742 [Ogataea polymorpha]|uniref:Uncharacterized protein n=1 Tax=Ogataea polymorpha TaxID=460523 RepID=A0A9P8NV06_9ASCO|nr:hypothetical protein OGATHE_005742 [Ogataea polymorpha]